MFIQFKHAQEVLNLGKIRCQFIYKIQILHIAISLLFHTMAQISLINCILSVDFTHVICYKFAISDQLYLNLLDKTNVSCARIKDFTVQKRKNNKLQYMN